jgi:heme a synthase
MVRIGASRNLDAPVPLDRGASSGEWMPRAGEPSMPGPPRRLIRLSGSRARSGARDDRVHRVTLSPRQYFVVAAVALVSLVAIVLTGAAVRLTDSGLGCPDWPRCYGGVVPPLQGHALIEYANRAFTGLVALAVIAASVLAWRRRPFRGHLALIGALLPVGVLCQAILGGLVVRYDLAPGLVMGHFILSMLLLDAAFALAWCSRYEPGERRPSNDRLGVWALRGMIPLGQLTILAGTITTGSGPDAGAVAGQVVHRFDFEGADTLRWMVVRHAAIATLFAFAAIGAYLLLRRDGGERRALRPLGCAIALVALQGVIGGVQWALELPTELVWVHVALATATWLATLWAVAAAGRLTRGPAVVAAELDVDRADAGSGPNE